MEILTGDYSKKTKPNKANFANQKGFSGAFYWSFRKRLYGMASHGDHSPSGFAMTF